MPQTLATPLQNYFGYPCQSGEGTPTVCREISLVISCNFLFCFINGFGPKTTLLCAAVLQMCNITRGKRLLPSRNRLPPGVAFWQNRGNFFLSRERLNPRRTKCVAAREGELTRLTGSSQLHKEIA